MEEQIKLDKIIEGLEALAHDLYEEGYTCGIKSGEDRDNWYKAWAIAMFQVANGKEYTDMLVIDCFNFINK